MNAYELILIVGLFLGCSWLMRKAMRGIDKRNRKPYVQS